MANNGRSITIILAGVAAVMLAVALWAVANRRADTPRPAAPAVPVAKATVAARPEAVVEKTPPAAPNDLAAAYRAAFDEAERASGLEPVGLVAVGDHLAVIATFTDPEPSHASNGGLSVQYVDRVGDGFRRVGSVAKVETGSFGAIAGWTMRRDLADDPIITVEGGGTWQGCTIAGVNLIRLEPDRPSVVSDFIPIHYQDESGMGDGGGWDATLTRAGDGIRVRYAGSLDTTIVYRREGDRFVTDKEPPAGC